MRNRILFLTIIFSLSIVLPLVHAAPSPEEVKERKEQAPLQVTGEVEEDVLYEDQSDESSYPHQIRKMNLVVDEIIKEPKDSNLSQGTSLEVYYSYVPSWVRTTGGKKMDIMNGDKIEIWLVEGEYGWNPALGGNTVDHIYYVESRKEHIPEPLTNKLKHFLDESLPTIVFVSLFLLLVGIMVFIRKLVIARKGY